MNGTFITNNANDNLEKDSQDKIQNNMQDKKPHSVNMEKSLNEKSLSHDSIIITCCKSLALRLVNMHRYLSSKNEHILSEKALLSGAEIGRIIIVADNSLTIKEYFNLIKSASSKAEETMYWIELLYESKWLSKEQFESIYSDCKKILDELNSMYISDKTTE